MAPVPKVAQLAPAVMVLLNLTFWIRAVPTTSSFIPAVGVVVPIPTFPLVFQIPVPGMVTLPLKVTAVAVDAPRAVTVAKVSASAPIFPLKVFQSADERAPVVVLLAVAIVMEGVVVPLVTLMGAVPETLVTVPPPVAEMVIPPAELVIVIPEP
jgi:hypothetical protein